MSLKWWQMGLQQQQTRTNVQYGPPPKLPRGPRASIVRTQQDKLQQEGYENELQHSMPRLSI